MAANGEMKRERLPPEGDEALERETIGDSAKYWRVNPKGKNIDF